MLWIAAGLLGGCEDGTTPVIPQTTPPSVPSSGTALRVTIGPPDPRAGVDDLQCLVDGAAADPVITWTHDGVAIAGIDGEFPNDTLPADHTRAGGTWSCRVDAGAAARSATAIPRVVGGNLLVVVADDLGRERLGAEGVTAGPYATTPNLDALAARSVRFPRAWATPTCSPTRATLLTGRLPRQHGVGTIIWPEDRYPLPDTEVFLPQVLAAADVPMTSALAGKWHLNVHDVGSGALQPGVAGFGSWSATNGNLEKVWIGSGGPFGYANWEHNVDGALSMRSDYATEVIVGDAVAAMASLPEPWFLYVPLHAMHEPWHTPPESWRYTSPSANPGIQEQSDLMLESLDVAVGALLAGLSPAQVETTTVIFLGDNGTMFTVARPPYDADHAKGTLYQGGVNVPFWVSGPLVTEPGAVSEALVHVADVFDTALALAGIAAHEADARVGGAPRVRYGQNVLPYVARPDRPSQRAIGYTEAFEPNGPPPWRGRHMTTTDGRFKLVFHSNLDDEVTELYDLAVDPFETVDLLAAPSPGEEALAAHEGLAAAMARFEADYPFDAIQPP